MEKVPVTWEFVGKPIGDGLHIFREIGSGKFQAYWRSGNVRIQVNSQADAILQAVAAYRRDRISPAIFEEALEKILRCRFTADGCVDLACLKP